MTHPYRTIGEYADAMGRSLAHMMQDLGAPPPAIKRGDTVNISVTAYVRKVNDDGTFVLAETPDPFAEPLTLDRCHPTRATVMRRAEPEPMVGDTITGRTVKATPWRRGTVIRFNGRPFRGGDRRYLLLGTGEWVNLDTGKTRTFASFQNAARYVVEQAPGKASRLETVTITSDAVWR